MPGFLIVRVWRHFVVSSGLQLAVLVWNLKTPLCYYTHTHTHTPPLHSPTQECDSRLWAMAQGMHLSGRGFQTLHDTIITQIRLSFEAAGNCWQIRKLDDNTLKTACDLLKWWLYVEMAPVTSWVGVSRLVQLGTSWHQCAIYTCCM